LESRTNLTCFVIQLFIIYDFHLLVEKLCPAVIFL